MKATAVLIEEHGAVRVMLRVLEKIIDKSQRGEEVNTSHLDNIVEFLQVFVDACHHGKEEDVLLPTIKNLGVEDNDRLTQVILDEHIQARNYTQGIKINLEKFKNGNKEAVNEIVKNGQLYMELINKHIDKENYTLFPRADKVLSDADQQKMYEEFEKIEIEKIGEGTHERLHTMIDQLKSVYLPQ